MAVTVVDLRTIVDEADVEGVDPTTPFWTGSSISAETDTFAEAPNAIIGTLNIDTGQVYVTISPSINIADVLIYIWSNNFALQGTWDAANPANALHLGDGTNRISFNMAGSNRKVFAHLDAGAGVTVDWDCLVLDGSQASVMDTAGDTVERAGTFASLDLTAITQLGSDFTTLSKGIGGGSNVAVDIIRIGNKGLEIIGGTTGDRGTFLEIVAEDSSTANQRAYGIIREFATGSYGVQGPLNFGDTGSTTTSWFSDSNISLIFEDRNISDDKYFIGLGGNSTGETHFILDNIAFTTAGPNVRVALSGTGVTEMSVTNTQFSNLGGVVEFGTDTDAVNHVVRNNTFIGCDRIDPQLVSFTNNSIISSVATQGAVRIVSVSGADTMSDLSFTMGVSPSHAIILASGIPSTITLDSFVFTDYGSDETSSSSIFNSSGAAITISIVNGVSPTVRNGDGSSTIVENNVPVTFTDLINSTEIRVYITGTLTEIAGQENITGGTFQFSTGAGDFVDIRIFAVDYLPVDFFNFEIPTTATSIPIQQIFDRNYSNP